MAKSLTFLAIAIFLTSCSKTYEAAPFTNDSLKCINQTFFNNKKQFDKEAAKAPIGSTQAKSILARYFVKAFEGCGYSADKTIYEFMSEATPTHIQMHQFAQNLQLGVFIMDVSSNNKEATNAYLAEKLMSPKTIELIKSKSK